MQILLGVLPLWACVFSRLELAHEVQHVLADEVARNGAPLKINFGQRFSWTPLAYLLLDFIWPTADLPQSSPLANEFTFRPAFLPNPVQHFAANSQLPAL